MIMLILVTLFVLAAINMSTTNLQVMGNDAGAKRGDSAAQQVIEQVVRARFHEEPGGLTITVDVTGDGTSDYSVAIAAPACLNFDSDQGHRARRDRPATTARASAASPA